MTLRIYLSGPMAGCTDGEMMDWRNDIKARWPQHRYHDPVRRDWRTNYKNNEKFIVELDKFDIECSNILLAVMDRYSAGTIMEIMYAWMKGKMVLVVNNLGHDLSPWILYHSLKSFGTIDEAMAYIDEQLDIDRKFNEPRTTAERLPAGC